MSVGALMAWLVAAEPAPSEPAPSEPAPRAETADPGRAEAPAGPSAPASSLADDDTDLETKGRTETAPFVRLSPGVLQAPWGFRTNYQWGVSAGAWFHERSLTGSIGGFVGHVLGWKDSHILRVGLQTQLGRLFAFDLIEPSIIARIGYTAFLHGNRSHGATVGVALGLDVSPDRRRRLVLGTAVGADLDFFTDVYLFPIYTWRVSIGWRFRPRVVASSP